MGQIISILLNFINRRLFIVFLDIEFLGYQSLFSNIFSILTVADLGIANLINFHLYRELANGNKEEIGKLMYIYKLFYRIVAICVFIIGIILCVFLPYIVRYQSLDWAYIRLIYFLQLGSVILGYFMAYRRTIYICDQKEFICAKTDIFCSISIQIIQIFALAITKNYLIYLMIHLSTTTISNIIITRLTNRDYPYLKKQYDVTREYFTEKKLFTDIRDVVIHKLCYLIYSGTDNIIISAFCGVRMVALYGNYYLISTGLTTLLTKIYNPLQATIGRIVYSGREKEELWKQYKMLDILGYFIASMSGLGLLIYYQFAIEVWMGKEFLFPFSFVVVYSVTVFLSMDNEMVYRYRATFGEFFRDRNYMILSMVLNIIISITLVKRFGIIGVQMGTLIAYLPIAYGRLRFVIGYYYGKQVKFFILTRIFHFFLFCIEGLAAYFMTRDMDISVLGFLERGIVWFIVSIVVNSVIFFKNPNYKLMLDYIKSVMTIIKMRI